MIKKKKLIVVGVIVAVLVAATIGGVAYAADSGSSTTTGKTLLARVATILGIDQAKLESAVTQAQKDIQTEKTTAYLNGLVAKGTITQAQADQYLKWWQSRPDDTQYRNQLRQWQQSRPNIPLPNARVPHGRVGPGGMMGRMAPRSGAPGPGTFGPGGMMGQGAFGPGGMMGGGY